MTPGAPILRLLIVLPSWVGDAVMATPALRLVRAAMPGILIGGLLRPGLDEILAGADLLDQLHVDRARGMMGPKHVAARLRPTRYDAALLLTNSFSTALITRLAFIPRRIGYDRDARGLLLTTRLQPPRRERPRARALPAEPVPPGPSDAPGPAEPAGAAPHAARPAAGLFPAGPRWAPVPAVEYYLTAARALLAEAGVAVPDLPPRLELGVTPQQEAAALALLDASHLHIPSRPLLVINPGGNNIAKRWPADRFAAVAAALARSTGAAVAVTGSPAEADLCRSIADAARDLGAEHAGSLAGAGLTLGSLKGVIRRASLVLTNDTGPRHLAAALGIPTVTLFGPTDPRWTTLPVDPARPGREIILVADPSLPPELVADDHPDRCRIDRIEADAVLHACESLLMSSR